MNGPGWLAFGTKLFKNTRCIGAGIQWYFDQKKHGTFLDVFLFILESLGVVKIKKVMKLCKWFIIQIWTLVSGNLQDLIIDSCITRQESALKCKPIWELWYLNCIFIPVFHKVSENFKMDRNVDVLCIKCSLICRVCVWFCVVVESRKWCHFSWHYLRRKNSDAASQMSLTLWFQRFVEMVIW